MSDFLYASGAYAPGELARCLQAIYPPEDCPETREFHGLWGSLAVTKSLYNGFQPLETDDALFVVIGGPILCFADNRFLTGADPVAGARLLYERYRSGCLRWEEDVSGPFVVFMVDKRQQTVRCVTDLLMMIPVYRHATEKTVMLGTHPDALARAAGQAGRFDPVSLTDFILHNVVTYPYTVYKEISQCHPAATHVVERRNGQARRLDPEVYWWPHESNPYETIGQAADVLRAGLMDYVGRAVAGMNHVAEFISGGEDSRAVAGMLPARLRRDAFVFLDKMNREGRIAQQAADACGVHFHAAFRGPTHYLDILPDASALIGQGHQYTHAHSLRFHASCGLDRYEGVFGGYSSDSLIKAMYSRQMKLFFLPQVFLPGETRSRSIRHPYFKEEVLRELDGRRRTHLGVLSAFRKESLHEWFLLWPATMRVCMPNLYANRRLFRTYEPFTCRQCVQVGAAVPTRWKLNRRLFQRTVKPFLRASRLVFHGQGYLPYYPWWVNVPVQGVVWCGRKAGIYLLRRPPGNPGPWADWVEVLKSRRWTECVERYGAEDAPDLATTCATPIRDLLTGDGLNYVQKVNVLQVLYACSPANPFSASLSQGSFVGSGSSPPNSP